MLAPFPPAHPSQTPFSVCLRPCSPPGTLPVPPRFQYQGGVPPSPPSPRELVTRWRRDWLPAPTPKTWPGSHTPRLTFPDQTLRPHGTSAAREGTCQKTSSPALFWTGPTGHQETGSRTHSWPGAWNPAPATRPASSRGSSTRTSRLLPIAGPSPPTCVDSRTDTLGPGTMPFARMVPRGPRKDPNPELPRRRPPAAGRDL